MSDKPKFETAKLGLFLALIGAISAGLLSVVAAMTKKPIEKAQLKKTNAAIEVVLPPFDNTPSKDSITIEAENSTSVKYYIAKKGGKVVGLAGEGYSMKGFSGKVTVMVGMEPSGRIRTVIVTKQNETPGLGTVVTDRKRDKTISDLFNEKKSAKGLPPNKILDGFAGHTTIVGGAPWKVKKDSGEFDFITGATISSRAVTGAVYTVASTYVDNKVAILKKFAAPIENKRKD
ncbi:MAG: RnfABCDGE type electron transport complex subunit G [Victivallales bacterium]|nr:RnfABCDGE type electron transport complex subunit G [Victivallales bacterium]